MCLLYQQVGAAQVGVLLERLLDECLQLRVGEDLLPGRIAEVGGVGRHGGISLRRVAIKFVNVFRGRLGPLVVAVEVTACEQSRTTYDIEKMLHL